MPEDGRWVGNPPYVDGWCGWAVGGGLETHPTLVVGVVGQWGVSWEPTLRGWSGGVGQRAVFEKGVNCPHRRAMS